MGRRFGRGSRPDLRGASAVANTAMPAGDGSSAVRAIRVDRPLGRRKMWLQKIHTQTRGGGVLCRATLGRVGSRRGRDRPKPSDEDASLPLTAATPRLFSAPTPRRDSAVGPSARPSFTWRGSRRRRSRASSVAQHRPHPLTCARAAARDSLTRSGVRDRDLLHTFRGPLPVSRRGVTGDAKAPSEASGYAGPAIAPPRDGALICRVACDRDHVGEFDEALLLPCNSRRRADQGQKKIGHAQTRSRAPMFDGLDHHHVEACGSHSSIARGLCGDAAERAGCGRGPDIGVDEAESQPIASCAGSSRGGANKDRRRSTIDLVALSNQTADRIDVGGFRRGRAVMRLGWTLRFGCSSVCPRSRADCLVVRAGSR